MIIVRDNVFRSRMLSCWLVFLVYSFVDTYILKFWRSWGGWSEDRLRQSLFCSSSLNRSENKKCALCPFCIYFFCRKKPLKNILKWKPHTRFLALFSSMWGSLPCHRSTGWYTLFWYTFFLEGLLFLWKCLLADNCAANDAGGLVPAVRWGATGVAGACRPPSFIC